MAESFADRFAFMAETPPQPAFDGQGLPDPRHLPGHATPRIQNKLSRPENPKKPELARPTQLTAGGRVETRDFRLFDARLDGTEKTGLPKLKARRLSVRH